MTKIEALHRSDEPSANGSAPLGLAIAASTRVLITGLGARKRALSALATTTGGVCLVLTELETECFATFAPGHDAIWFVHGASPRTVVVWGLVRSDVSSVDVVTAAGTEVAATFGHSGFYAEVVDGPPDHLVLHHDDGDSEAVAVLPCPLTTPDCTS